MSNDYRCPGCGRATFTGYLDRRDCSHCRSEVLVVVEREHIFDLADGWCHTHRAFCSLANNN